MSKYLTIDVTFLDGKAVITSGAVDMRAALTMEPVATCSDIPIQESYDWPWAAFMIDGCSSKKQLREAVRRINEHIHTLEGQLPDNPAPRSPENDDRARRMISVRLPPTNH